MTLGSDVMAESQEPLTEQRDSGGSAERERAMGALMALWPHTPIPLGEADAILEEIDFDQLVAERNRYRDALEYLANRPYDEGYREVARSALSGCRS